MNKKPLTKQINSLISLQNVVLTLADQSIFSHLSLTFNIGEKVALLGDSGVGKSSLLKLIAGIHQPTQGELTNKALRIGYVFQEPRLLPWLTVEQNITEVMKANGIIKMQREIKLTELLTQVELTQYRHYYPHQLSGGMAQRVSLARAFAIEPDLLLLDEPFSALDKNLTQQLSQLLSRFLKPETTMIYVSHYIEQVLPLAQSCLFLHNASSTQKKKFTWHSTANAIEREQFLKQFYQ
ncbi:MAG: nitrate ABC transporter ATP-binding protein [Colwellia sp.]|nr:MAG: nitrate ABC transporter ATP-binding protein [Colwellia sp.]